MSSSIIPFRGSSPRRVSVLSLIMIPSLLLYQIGLLSRGGGGGGVLSSSSSSSSTRSLLWSANQANLQEAVIMMALRLQEDDMVESKLQSSSSTTINETRKTADWVENIIMLYNHNVTYRLSTTGLQNANANNSNKNHKTSIVVGVLSSVKTRDKRDAVRQTWGAASAANRSNAVFFLLAGDWEDVKDEFMEFHDIFWIDHVESYNELVWKTSAFFVAMQNHANNNFTHIVKTDDDSYVHLDRLEEHLSTTINANESATNSSSTDALDYTGNCMDWQMRSPGATSEALERLYPPYASGAGYVLSRRFATCFARVAQHFYYAVIPEDATTGIIARECRVTCTNDPRVISWPEANPEERLLQDDSDNHPLIQHYIDPPTMYLIHSMKKNCASSPFNNGTIRDTTTSTSYNPSCSPDDKSSNLVFGGTVPILMKHGKVAYRFASPSKRGGVDTHQQHEEHLASDGDGGGVAVAVLSTPSKQGRDRRSAIRNTWAKKKNHRNSSDHVYFIVATSDYNYVKHEFFQHRDIFWIVNEREDDQQHHRHHNHHDNSDKLSVFAAAIQKHLKSNNNNMTAFRHILKVDDDVSYVRLDDLEQASFHEYRNKDFIGNCTSSSLVNVTTSNSIQKTLDSTKSSYLMSMRFAECLAHTNNDMFWTNDKFNRSRLAVGAEEATSATWCRRRQFECFAWNDEHDDDKFFAPVKVAM